MTQLECRLAAAQSRIEEYLRTRFRDREPKDRLYEAMNYSLLSGGKRIRPVLTLESCRICGGDPETALPFACAVEMVHTYSLIHDDLPCMDDDDLRRGRPSNHKVFGEATAMLAGDGLLTAAFEEIAGQGERMPAQRIVEGTLCLAGAAGAEGMVGGQALDLAGEGRTLTEEELHRIHDLKTGAMIAAAVQLGCIAAGADGNARQALDTYARCVGLAFQIRDDMLDVEGNEAEFGKAIGSDAGNGKMTFVNLLGLDGCKREVERLTGAAVKALDTFQDRDFLRELAWYLAGRTR